MPTIIDIEFRRRRPEKFIIIWDTGEETIFAPETVLKHALSMGRKLEEKEFDLVVRENAVCLAKEQMLRYLAMRPHSRQELFLKTSRRDHASEAIESALDDFERAGLINDEVFTRQFTLNEINFRPCGRMKLQEKLYRRGIDESISKPILDELYIQYPAKDLISIVANKFVQRNRRLEQQKLVERLTRHLQGKGFDWETIRWAMLDQKLGKRDMD
ncbi:MAG: regulatory protein RecX [Calditrichia bacterium]